MTLLLPNLQGAEHLAEEGAVLAVEMGVEETGAVLERCDIVVGEGGWDKAGMACTEDDFLLGTFVMAKADATAALDAHGDDEGVVLHEVAMEGFLEVHHSDVEIGGVDDLLCLVGAVAVVGAVLGGYAVVDGVEGELGV